jgi:aquaporin Z
MRILPKEGIISLCLRKESSQQRARGLEMSVISPSKKYVAEMIGTFVLVAMGCGCAVLAGKDFGGLTGTGTVGISLAFGLAALIMVYTFGWISGCHINPAVSISMVAAGRMSARDAFAYIVAQCAGAVLGAAALCGIAVGNTDYSLAVNGLGQNGFEAASPAGYSMTSAFVAEVLLTFIFLLVILGSTSEKAPKGFAGISIGLSLALIHLVGIPITGTSVNPARSLGPAVIVGGTALNQLWLFWLAPTIGGLLAAAVYRKLE